VGNYYLPASMGGGVDEALKDSIKPLRWTRSFQMRILERHHLAKSESPNAEARKALEQALQMKPGRFGPNKQLEKFRRNKCCGPRSLCLSLLAVTWLEFKSFRVRSYLQSGTQVMCRIQRLSTPGYLSRDYSVKHGYC